MILESCVEWHGMAWHKKSKTYIFSAIKYPTGSYGCVDKYERPNGCFMEPMLDGEMQVACYCKSDSCNAEDFGEPNFSSAFKALFLPEKWDLTNLLVKTYSYHLILICFRKHNSGKHLSFRTLHNFEPNNGLANSNYEQEVNGEILHSFTNYMTWITKSRVFKKIKGSFLDFKFFRYGIFF